MITPSVRLYAELVDITGNGKTSKYRLIKMAGYYPPIELLRGKDGCISMYLQASKDSGSADNAPSMRLQAKGSLNFTGLKDYFVEGKLSGYAYGYPLSDKIYSSKQKPNPFYDYRNDGFMFIIHQDKNALRPSSIELIVLENARALIQSYCKQLVMGGFDDVLELFRMQAMPYNNM